MTKRLAGVVVEKEVAPTTNTDFIGLGLRAFGHRAEISQLIGQAMPIIDVATIQIPRIMELAKTLAPELLPEWQTSLADTAGGVVCMFNVRWVQESLTALRYNVGPVDGFLGHQSRAAVRKFQEEHDLLPDEWPGRETCLRIGEELRRKGGTSP